MQRRRQVSRGTADSNILACRPRSRKLPAKMEVIKARPRRAVICDNDNSRTERISSPIFHQRALFQRVKNFILKRELAGGGFGLKPPREYPIFLSAENAVRRPRGVQRRAAFCRLYERRGLIR